MNRDIGYILAEAIVDRLNETKWNPNDFKLEVDNDQYIPYRKIIKLTYRPTGFSHEYWMIVEGWDEKWIKDRFLRQFENFLTQISPWEVLYDPNGVFKS